MTITTGNRRKKLKRLAKMMNSKNEMLVPLVGGVIDLMDSVALDEDIDFLLNLGIEPHTFQQAADKTDRPTDQARNYLEELVKKGWTAPYTFESGETGYELIPIVVGWLEMQLCAGGEGPKEKLFADKLQDLFASLEKFNVFPLRPLGNFFADKLVKPWQSIGAVQPPDGPAPGSRQVDINQTVSTAIQSTSPTPYISELIDRHGRDNKIAVMHCFCRHFRKLTNDPCRFDIRPETCLVIGPMASHIAEYDFGRFITRQDAINIVEEVSKAGAIHTLFHEKDNTKLPHVAICNCCWDCCGLYGSYNRGLMPLYFQSYYEARLVNTENCIGCGLCVKHCPTGCVELTADKKAVIDGKKCIGCGQCARQCPNNTIILIPNRRDVMVPMMKKSEARIQ